MAQLDLKLFGNELILDDIVDAAIQELDILFGTEETELLGDYKYGMNLEQFLWKLQPDEAKVETYIREKIMNYTYFCTQLNISVSVKTLLGTVRDIYVIEISIRDANGETIKIKNYTFN